MPMNCANSLHRRIQTRQRSLHALHDLTKDHGKCHDCRLRIHIHKHTSSPGSRSTVPSPIVIVRFTRPLKVEPSSQDATTACVRLGPLCIFSIHAENLLASCDRGCRSHYDTWSVSDLTSLILLQCSRMMDRSLKSDFSLLC